MLRGRAEPPGEPVSTAARTLPGASLAWGVLEEIAGMLHLTWRALRLSLTPPFTWWDEFVTQAYITLSRCLMPVVVSTSAFGFGNAGVQPGNLLNVFGSVDRSGAFLVAASVREFAPWVNAMVIAGIAGTAICADLGARRARDELDALAVMGIDATRSLVVPRFLALGIVTALMNVVAIVCGIGGAMIASTAIFGESIAAFLQTFTSNFTLPDLAGSLIKTSLFGFIVAAVCCYKGMHVKGGPEGVGRAVNQAVVIAFAGIWAFNFMFTALLLGAFPEVGNLH